MNVMQPLLHADELQVFHGKQRILHIPRLTLYSEEILAVMGPNGAGKSTLLRVLAALQRPQRGRIFFHQRPISWRRSLAYRRRIAVVLQVPLLLNASVYRNTALGLYLRGMWGKQAQDRVHHWLEQFRVAHLASRNALDLSGGEAQRVALARAFVLEPEILFLDEPFSGLDMPTRIELLTDLRRVLRGTHTTVLLVTHDRDEARALADRVAVLFEGRIRQVGTVEEIFRHPIDVEVATFVGMENCLQGILTHREGGKCVDLGVGLCLPVYTQLPAGHPVHICIRPEDIRLHAAKPPSTGEGRVIDVLPQGAHVRLNVRVGSHLWRVLLPDREWRQSRLCAGTAVHMDVAPEDVHVIPAIEEKSV